MNHVTTADANSPDELRERARAEASARRWFALHIMVFVVVIGVNAIVDAADGDGWRVHWMLLGWGIGLAAHAIVVLAPNRFLGAWEQRQTDRIAARLERDREVRS